MNEFTKALNERFLLQEEYLGNKKPVNYITPVISITVATYQHVNYIKKCLDGILMQQTNFPYEIILGEDGSTDGTQAICKTYAERYPDKIRLFIRDRKLSQFVDSKGTTYRFNGIWNRMSARGKYIAMCEGDDYWIDPLKLQKQTNFLEKNSEYVLVCSNRIVIDATGRRIVVNSLKCKKDISTTDLLLKSNPIITASTLFRTTDVLKASEALNDIPFKILMGDYPLWIILSTVGKIRYMNQKMVVYRVLTESASHSLDYHKIIAFVKNEFLIKEYYLKQMNLQVKKDYLSKQMCKTAVRKLVGHPSFYSFLFKSLKQYPILFLNIKVYYCLFLNIYRSSF